MYEEIIYVAAGFLGGFTYCIMPPMELSPRIMFQRTFLGGLVGFVDCLLNNLASPSPFILLLVLGHGYFCIDVLKSFFIKAMGDKK